MNESLAICSLRAWKGFYRWEPKVEHLDWSYGYVKCLRISQWNMITRRLPQVLRFRLKGFLVSPDISIIFFLFYDSSFRRVGPVLWVWEEREQRFIILFIFTLIHFFSRFSSFIFHSPLFFFLCSYFYDLLHVLWHRHKMNGAEREMKDTSGSWSSQQSLIHRLPRSFLFICFWWWISMSGHHEEKSEALIYCAFRYEFARISSLVRESKYRILMFRRCFCSNEVCLCLCQAWLGLVEIRAMRKAPKIAGILWLTENNPRRQNLPKIFG